MTVSHNPLENGLLSGFDLRALWETVRLRWWVIPITPLLAVGFLWVQETDLRTEPASYFVSRTYEGRDPTGVLASVGIDPVSVRSFPDVNNQLLILQSTAVRNEITKRIGNAATVNVSRSRPTFTLIDTLEGDGQSSLIFQSAGAPTYSFSCNESERATCTKAIDAYVTKASELRSEALREGLMTLSSVLTETNKSLSDPSLELKQSAIKALLQNTEMPLVLISEYEEARGAVVNTVSRPTYSFGIGAGLLVSALILLQLAHSDTRVRSLNTLSRLVGQQRTLGSISFHANELSERQVVISIRRKLTETGASQLRFIPIRDDVGDASLLERLAKLTQAATHTSLPATKIPLDDLTRPSSDELDIFIVQRNRDRRADVMEAKMLAQRSPRKSAGFLLVD